MSVYSPQHRLDTPRRMKVPKVIWNPWTVGDFERVAFMRKHEGYTAEDIAVLLRSEPLAATPEHLRRTADAFGVQLRKAAS